ncbi:Uma2 family endonuclease [Deferribacter autotrophicus]|uniref:Uma2 family endonuclease n=1 Tax=Deferribacter autotrophicus TaxID=500465 RepID=A0A5A8F6D6_9BACT|nr:Uma2 family endonuclease [Deferribacter autotrophicus]KAA0258779.1 Uma2 family endonuclease [Deferribacter autotrophicus]
MGTIKIEDLPRYTYEDYKYWEGKWELINGIAYAMSPSPNAKHQRVSSKINWLLEELFKDYKKCKVYLPIDWKISDDTVVQPDNLVLCYDAGDKPYITKAPKIIFEVLSKSTFRKDTVIKFNIYEQEGVKYYVIVNPDDKIAKVYELKDGRYIKICDATDEIIEFYIEECDNKIQFDFSKIWDD